MGLADAIAVAAQKPGTRCTVGELIATMSPEDVKALNAAFDTRAISSSAIMRGLAAEGYVATRSPLERHRAKECACDPR